MKKIQFVALVFIAAVSGLAACGPVPQGGGGAPTPTPDSEITVNSVGDEGQGLCSQPGETCTLRAAINRANATAGTVLIRFNIPESEVVKMIRPESPLPAVTNTVIIDGTTQPGWVGGHHPLIEIEGSYAGSSSGLTVRGAGSVIKGLMITDFHRNGIDVRGPDVIILQSYLGTDGGNDVDLGNTGWGIDVSCNADGSDIPLRVRIGEINDGNLISGNDQGGVNIDFDPCNGRESGAKVYGNIIGLDAAGDGLLGNGGPGVRIQHASQNEIGGPLAGRQNWISGNHGNGVEVLRTASENNTIHNNRIGIDRGGALARGNWTNGVYSEGNLTLVGGTDPSTGNVISGNHEEGVLIALGPALIQGNRIGISEDGTAALGNLEGIVVKSCNTGVQIGGNLSAARNVISGNTNNGILIRDSNPCDDGNVTINNNRIGTNPDGTQAIGNQIGILVWANHVTVGDPYSGSGNLISGNLSHGLLVQSNDNLIAGNLIGKGAGDNPLPNGEAGILMKSGASGNIVERNVVRDNGGAGVQIVGGGTGNSIRRNYLYENGGLGIALDGDDPLENDNLDGDDGSNHRQNHPTLSAAELDGDTVSVTGTIRSGLSTAYTIDIYTNLACDPSGFGEGRLWITQVNVITNSQGLALFTVDFPAAGNDATAVTATATNMAGDTSDFSQCIPVTGAPTPTPQPAGMKFTPSLSDTKLFFGRCDQTKIDISVAITGSPQPIGYVLLFARLMDRASGAKSKWTDGLSMIPAGNDVYRFTLLAEDLPDYVNYRDAVLQYQFVAYDKNQQLLGRSDVYGDVAFGVCGRPGTTG
jgi:CSLREA domain-containing protein